MFDSKGRLLAVFAGVFLTVVLIMVILFVLDF